MRTKQLISVDHLPTIFETHDEAYHDNVYTKDAGPGSGCNLSQTQDDYLKSICQLAQPTFLFDTSSKTQSSSHADNSPRSPKQMAGHLRQAECPSPVSLLRRNKEGNCLSELADAFSLNAIAITVNSQNCSQTLGNNPDPFSWLFGQSNKENQRSSQQFPRQHSLATYPNEGNCSRKSHWLSLDHMVTAANKPHEKQPSPLRGKASSMGHPAIMKGKLASSELFSYHQSGNK